MLSLKAGCIEIKLMRVAMRLASRILSREVDTCERKPKTDKTNSMFCSFRLSMSCCNTDWNPFSNAHSASFSGTLARCWIIARHFCWILSFSEARKLFRMLREAPS